MMILDTYSCRHRTPFAHSCLYVLKREYTFDSSNFTDLTYMYMYAIKLHVYMVSALIHNHAQVHVNELMIIIGQLSIIY